MPGMEVDNFKTRVFWMVLLIVYLPGTCSKDGEESPQCPDCIDCKTLLVGQYLCTNKNIDPKTQQAKDCNREGKAWETCEAAPGIKCDFENSGNQTFRREVDCKWTNGYSFETALILSIFMGCFGLDRFYLGYPAIGLLKFCTLGFFFIGHLVDIILIASQAVGPADGSHYVISYFGAGLSTVMVTNETYRREQADWF